MKYDSVRFISLFALRPCLVRSQKKSKLIHLSSLREWILQLAKIVAEEHFTFKINVFKFFFSLLYIEKTSRTRFDPSKFFCLSCHRALNFTLSRFICRSSDLTALSYFAPPPRVISSKDNTKKGAKVIMKYGWE